MVMDAAALLTPAQGWANLLSKRLGLSKFTVECIKTEREFGFEAFCSFRASGEEECGMCWGRAPDPLELAGGRGKGFYPGAGFGELELHFGSEGSRVCLGKI